VKERKEIVGVMKRLRERMEGVIKEIDLWIHCSHTQ
jgi:hypothetical protein